MPFVNTGQKSSPLHRLLRQRQSFFLCACMSVFPNPFLPEVLSKPHRDLARMGYSLLQRMMLQKSRQSREGCQKSLLMKRKSWEAPPGVQAALSFLLCFSPLSVTRVGINLGFFKLISNNKEGLLFQISLGVTRTVKTCHGLLCSEIRVGTSYWLLAFTSSQHRPWLQYFHPFNSA